MDLPPEAIPSQGFWKGTHKRLTGGALASRIHRRFLRRRTVVGKLALLRCWEEVEPTTARAG
jgi:hypothetical protein